MTRAAVCVALFSLACQKQSAKGLEQVHLPGDPTGRDGVHGMVLFGERELYVSHIPMFHAPHDVQLVARVRVTGVEGNLPTAFGDGLYTLAPERFRLNSLVGGALKTFRADVYRGNFEDGGEKLGTAYVAIDTILVARPLGGVASNDEYYVFGAGDEWWAVHRVGETPSFDAIARVSFAKPPRPGRYVKAGDTPLHAGDELRGSGSAVNVSEAHVLSCLVGPDFVSPCQ